MKKLLAIGVVMAAAGAFLLRGERTTQGYVLYSGSPKWGGPPVPSPTAEDLVKWRFNSAGTPDMGVGPTDIADQTGEFGQLADCLDEWEVATGGNLDMEYDGTTSAGMGGDGQNTVVFVESGWGWGSSAIGVCSFSYSSGVMREADVGFNGQDFTWGSSTLLRKVALHEYGHGIGLAHSSTSGAIMQPVVGSNSELQPDDIDGARALYGLGAGGDGVVPGPPPDPTPDPDPPPPDPDPVPIDPEPTPRPTSDQPKQPNNPTPAPSDDDDDDDAVNWDDDDDDYGGGLKGRYRKYKDKYCIVATAACGSPNASRVDVLRAMRDRSLKGTEDGSRFVGLYEKSAAPVARVVKRSELLRALVREMLPK